MKSILLPITTQSAVTNVTVWYTCIVTIFAKKETACSDLNDTEFATLTSQMGILPKRKDGNLQFLINLMLLLKMRGTSVSITQVIN